LKEQAKEIQAKIAAATAGVDGVQINIAAKYGVGTQIGTLAHVSKVFEEGHTDLVHKEGEVWLCDLWATWCPPCQKPMAHNQEMLEKHADWEGKARILGLSIDDDTATVKSHVEDKKWQKVEHYLCGEGCSVSDEYGSGGVPHVFLVDQKGKIVFMGHPSERNLEEDIEKLIKGEEITGKGTGSEEVAANDASAETTETKSEDAFNEAKSKFLSDTKALAEDADFKELVAQL
jgi:thiol-disulfide isomerase/thioredoxin